MTISACARAGRPTFARPSSPNCSPASRRGFNKCPRSPDPSTTAIADGQFHLHQSGQSRSAAGKCHHGLRRRGPDAALDRRPDPVDGLVFHHHQEARSSPPAPARSSSQCKTGSAASLQQCIVRRQRGRRRHRNLRNGRQWRRDDDVRQFRDADFNGALNFVVGAPVNMASETTSGLDFQADYRMDLFGGLLDWHVLGNYNDERTRTIPTTLVRPWSLGWRRRGRRVKPFSRSSPGPSSTPPLPRPIRRASGKGPSRAASSAPPGWSIPGWKA